MTDLIPNIRVTVFLEIRFILNWCLRSNKTIQWISETSRCTLSVWLKLSGISNTAATLNALIALLVNKPEIQQQMADKIKSVLGESPPCLADRKSLHYVEAAILEVLRYTSLQPLNVAHCTMEDTTMNGYDIPKDTEVCTWMILYSPRHLSTEVVNTHAPFTCIYVYKNSLLLLQEAWIFMFILLM